MRGVGNISVALPGNFELRHVPACVFVHCAENVTVRDVECGAVGENVDGERHAQHFAGLVPLNFGPEVQTCSLRFQNNGLADG